MDAFFQNLLLPLLGGFFFVLVHGRLRHTFFVFASGEKLILACAGIGVVAKLLLHLIVLLIDVAFPGFADKATRDTDPFPMIDIAALFAPLLVAAALNRFTDPETEYREVLNTLAGELERTIDRGSRDQKPLMLSLHSGRVYVGMVTSTRRRALRGNAHSHLRIIPLMSGYRVPLTGGLPDADRPGQVVFTTYYEDAVATVLDASSYAEGEVTVTAEDGRTIRFDPRDIAIILPIDQIETATLFDERVYAFLNRERDPRAWRALSASQSGA